VAFLLVDLVEDLEKDTAAARQIAARVNVG
jgi:hypothetical protein